MKRKWRRLFGMSFNTFCQLLFAALVYRCTLANVRMRKNDEKTVRRVQDILSHQGELNVKIE